jgi:hypothetical protein
VGKISDYGIPFAWWSFFCIKINCNESVCTHAIWQWHNPIDRNLSRIQLVWVGPWYLLCWSCRSCDAAAITLTFGIRTRVKRTFSGNNLFPEKLSSFANFFRQLSFSDDFRLFGFNFYHFQTSFAKTNHGEFLVELVSSVQPKYWCMNIHICIK